MEILIARPLPLVFEILLLALVLPAAVYDIRFRRIPNWLCVAGFGIGVLSHLLYGGLRGLGDSLAGFGIAFGVYFVFYLLHFMGAGDVKLMGAAGAIAGPHPWFTVFALGSVFGLFAALFLAVSKGRLGATLWNVGYLLRELASLRKPWLTREQLDVKNPEALRLPHAVNVAAGSIAAIWLTHLLWSN